MYIFKKKRKVSVYMNAYSSTEQLPDTEAQPWSKVQKPRFWANFGLILT